MSRCPSARWFLPALLVCALPPAVAEESAGRMPEVYRNEHLVVRAGVAGGQTSRLQLGDVRSVVVTVSWNGESVVIEDDGPVHAAWPEEAGLVLLGRETTRGPGSGRFTDEQRTEFRFQILGCPAEEAACPGQRRYVLPELTLEYGLRGAESPAAVTFLPEPPVLTVMSDIAADGDGRLAPFSTYFPEGAYPAPLTVEDRNRASLAAAGTGLLMLIGGLLMWPFRLRGKSPFSSAEVPRWRELLRQLQDDDEEDHFRLAERMRRCLVWYCSDELRLDAFEWLEAADRDEGAPEHADLRALFTHLLHDPSGRSAELRARLTLLLAHGG